MMFLARIMDDVCWVELDACKQPIRIFRTINAALSSPAFDQGLVMEWGRAAAIASIRLRVFVRDSFMCVHCGEDVTWDGPNKGEMHERIWRGRGGEISVENSVTLCQECHRYDEVAGHGKRQVQFSQSVV